jgi:hypothetical protein
MPPAKTDYGREISRLLRALALKQAELASSELGHSLIKQLCRSAVTPSAAAHRALVASIDAALRRALRPARGRDQVFARLAEFSWIICDPAGGTACVDAAALLEFAPDRVRRFSATASGRRLELVVEFHTPLRAFTAPEQAKLLQLRLFFGAMRKALMLSLRDGCTEAVLAMEDEAQAAALVQAFVAGDLDGDSVVAVYPRFNFTPFADALATAVDLSSPDAEAQLARAWHRARRLRWLRAFGTELAESLDAFLLLAWPRYSGRAAARRSVRASARAFLAAAGASRAGGAALWRRGFVQWPLLASAILVVSFTLARSAGLAAAPGFAIASSLALAYVGSLNCALSTSPLAGAAGAAGLAISFGLAHGLLAPLAGGPAMLARALGEAGPFVAVVGGIMGARAADLRLLPGPLALALLVATGATIVWSGWLMTRPAGAQPAVMRARPQPWRGTFLGASMGAAIGLILGATRLSRTWLGSGQPGFIAAFALLGALACARTVWLATADRDRARRFGAAHFACTLALMAGVESLRHSPAGAVVTSAATGYFHATFFMAALLTGWSVGGRHAAVAAAGLEGAGGYLGFVLFRFLQ